MSASEGLFFLGLAAWITCVVLTLVSLAITVLMEPNSDASDAGQLIVGVFLIAVVALSIIELTAMTEHVRWVG